MTLPRNFKALPHNKKVKNNARTKSHKNETLFFGKKIIIPKNLIFLIS